MTDLVNNTSTDVPDAQFLRDIACRSCITARELIVDARKNLLSDAGTIPFDKKSSEVDPVTPIDRAAEEHIRKVITEQRPGDGFIGEEFGRLKSSTGVEWIVDPIDGTVNFLYGIPAYSVSVAAAYDGVIVAGAVIDVAHNILYFAHRGGGSFRIDRSVSAEPIRNVPGKVTELTRALLGAGFGYASHVRKKQIAVYSQVLPIFRDMRRIGSAALDLAFVASGVLDVFFEYGLNPWDYAAGALIATEAGATVGHPSIYADHSSQSQLVWASSNDTLTEAWEKLRSETDIPDSI